MKEQILPRGFRITLFIEAFMTAFVAVAITWLYWVQIRAFLFSIIPDNAVEVWAGKIFICIVLAFFGGLAIPYVLFIKSFVQIKLCYEGKIVTKDKTLKENEVDIDV